MFDSHDDSPQLPEGGNPHAKGDAAAEIEKLIEMLVKYTQELGQRIAEAHQGDVILTNDEARRLYAVLSDLLIC